VIKIDVDEKHKYASSNEPRAQGDDGSKKVIEPGPGLVFALAQIHCKHLGNGEKHLHAWLSVYAFTHVNHSVDSCAAAWQSQRCANACLRNRKKQSRQWKPHHTLIRKRKLAWYLELSLTCVGLARTVHTQFTIISVYIRYVWQGNHEVYGHTRCMYSVLANQYKCNLDKTIQSESMTRAKPFFGRGTQVLAEH